MLAEIEKKREVIAAMERLIRNQQKLINEQQAIINELNKLRPDFRKN